MSTHKKRQNCEIKQFLGKSKGQMVGEAQGFCCFCIKRGKLERIRGFFLGKNCEPLFVRGTTLFYNKKLQICLLEKVLCGMFECDKMNNVEGELFHFQLCFINYESVLTF